MILYSIYIHFINRMNIDKVKEIILEMLNQRGYKNIIKIDDLIIEATKQSNEKMCVILSNISSLGVERMKEYVNYMEKNKYKHGIIVYISVTSKATKIIENENIANKIIELFEHKELMFNITKHIYVPKHIKLDNEEAIQFKEKFGIQFAGIKTTDPISKFYFYSKGDVIKIIQNNGFVSFSIVR